MQSRNDNPQTTKVNMEDVRAGFVLGVVFASFVFCLGVTILSGLHG